MTTTSEHTMTEDIACCKPESVNHLIEDISNMWDYTQSYEDDYSEPSAVCYSTTQRLEQSCEAAAATAEYPLSLTLTPELESLLMSYFRLDTVRELYAHMTLKNLGLDLETLDVLRRCEDPKLRTALLINRLQYAELDKLEDKIKNVANLVSLVKGSDQGHTIVTRSRSINYGALGGRDRIGHLKPRNTSGKFMQMSSKKVLTVGIPYFKTTHNNAFPARNADYLEMVERGEYMYLEEEPFVPWTLKDHKLLFAAISASFYESESKRLRRELKTARVRSKRFPDDSTILDTVDTLKQQLDKLKRDKEEDKAYPKLGDDTTLDWHSISQVDLNDRHSAVECRTFWNVFLHPSLNKEPFSPEEDSQIRQLVEKQGMRRWNLIAERIGTNRSSFLIMMHYSYRLNTKRARFTPEDDARLIAAVAELCRGKRREVPWTAIAGRFINQFSKLQLYHRYKYVLQYRGQTKGPFCEAEDVLLSLLIERNSYDDLIGIVTHIPNRNVKQLRYRYWSYLQGKDFTKESFTLEEDKKVMDYVRVHGEKRWASIAAQVNRKPGIVRQRYHTLKNLLTKDSNLRLEDIKRRKSKRTENPDKSSQRRTLIRDIVMQLNEDLGTECIPTVKIIQMYIDRHKSGKMVSYHDLIDDDKDNKKLPPATNETDSIEMPISSSSSHTNENATVITSENCSETDELLTDFFTKNQPYVDLFAHHLGDSETTCVDRFINCKSDETLVLPPSDCTMLGFRSLFIGKNDDGNNFEAKFDAIDASLLTVDSSLAARRAFEQRLFGLFFWPYVLHKNADVIGRFNASVGLPPPPSPSPFVKRWQQEPRDDSIKTLPHGKKKRALPLQALWKKPQTPPSAKRIKTDPDLRYKKSSMLSRCHKPPKTEVRAGGSTATNEATNWKDHLNNLKMEADEL